MAGHKNDKYMSFEMNMLIIYHVHHLSTEMEGKKPTKVPKSTPKNASKASPIIYHRMPSIPVEPLEFSAVAKIVVSC